MTIAAARDLDWEREEMEYRWATVRGVKSKSGTGRPVASNWEERKALISAMRAASVAAPEAGGVSRGERRSDMVSIFCENCRQFSGGF